MNENVTLNQLVGAVTQLQRLDMIYGPVTRPAQPPAAAPLKRPAAPLPAPEISLSAHALMDPGSMLASLHQYAVKAGLTIPTAAMEHLQPNLPAAEAKP